MGEPARGSLPGLGAGAECLLGYGISSMWFRYPMQRFGEELSAVTDRIDPIRGDIAELRHAMERRFTALEARVDARIEASAKDQTRFFFVAWGVLLAAIVGLYGAMVALLR